MSADATTESATRPTIVIGLGNPILGDDGVGWRVVEALGERLGPDAPVELDRLAVGGLGLMERLIGFRRAVLVDAIVTGLDPPGTVRRLALEELPGRGAGHVDGAHDASLSDALAAGRALGADLPDDIAVVSIEADRVDEFGEVLTPPVAAAIPAAVEAALAALATMAARST